MERVDAGALAISIVTIAEARAGYVNAGWGERRVEAEERRLAAFPPILIEDPHLNEWARLSVAARGAGIVLSDTTCGSRRRRAFKVRCS